MRMEFPKMDSYVSKVPSKQSKLQFQSSQKLKYSAKSINLSFPSTSTVTSKTKMLPILSLRMILVLHVKRH